MSLLSAIILPRLEKELINMEPQIAQFLVEQLKVVGSELLSWIESKGNAAAAKIPGNVRQ